MDPISQWLTDRKIPVGKYCERGIRWMQENLDFFFDPFSDSLGGMLEASGDALIAVPPPIFIAAIAAVAVARHRSWKLAAFCILALGYILNQGYWEKTMLTLACVLWATLLCLAVGVPFGVFCARRPGFYRSSVQPALDMMQTLPTFVYLIPMLALFGLGFVPGLVATIIFAVPAVVRLTYLGVSGVPKNLTEVGQSYGATRWQLLRRVEIPHAIPSIMTGMTQCIMLSLSMVVIAALVGTPGLGVPVIRALNTGPRGVALGFESGLCIVVLAIVIDRLCRVSSPNARA